MDGGRRGSGRKQSDTIVRGIEKNEKLAELAKQISNVICEDILTIDIAGNPNYDEKYDYIILDDVLKKDDISGKLLIKAVQCAKPYARLLVSVHNQQCVRQAEYGFTLEEIVALFNQCGLELKEFNYRPLKCNQSEMEALEKIMQQSDQSERPLYEAEKFIFAAEVRG